MHLNAYDCQLVFPKLCYIIAERKEKLTWSLFLMEIPIMLLH